MSFVIGLIGRAKSGKSTTQKHLERALGAVEIQYAKKLKDVCAKVFGVERDHFDNQDFKEVPLAESRVLTMDKCLEILKEWGVKVIVDPEKMESICGKVMPTPRSIAQIVGTDFLRNLVDTDIHIKSGFEGMKEGGVYVASDTRYENEYKATKAMPRNLTVGIIRPSLPPLPADAHESERYIEELIKKCDVVLENSGTMEEFLEKIEKQIVLRVLK